MPETIHIGSASGTIFALALFALICAALGYISYSLLARPETRRAQFRRLGAVSRRTSLLLAISFSAALFALICNSMFTGFNRMEIAGERVRLRYLLPRGGVQFGRDQLTLLEKKYAYKFSWRLAITTSDGRRYESQPASAAAIEAARLRLAQFAAE